MAVLKPSKIMGSLKFVSLADSVFEQLENDILTGKYEKSQVLTEIALSKELGISRTPIREAIKRLEQENLVRLTSRGIVVLGLSEKDIEDIYEVRCRIESLAIERCVNNISDSDLVKLKEIIDLQEFYTLKKDAEDIKETDSKFHHFIYTNCGSYILENILTSLHRKYKNTESFPFRTVQEPKWQLKNIEKFIRRWFCVMQSLPQNLPANISLMPRQV